MVGIISAGALTCSFSAKKGDFLPLWASTNGGTYRIIDPNDYILSNLTVVSYIVSGYDAALLFQAQADGTCSFTYNAFQYGVQLRPE